MRITYCDRCGKETESPIRTLCKKCWTELEEELLYPKTPYITNADRIRAMTDEELANKMYDWFSEDCLSCPVLKDDCPVWEIGNIRCYDAILDWVRQEATE